MPRVKGSVQTRRRRKKVLKLAKGYFGSKHVLFKTANEQVMHSLRYAYRDRKQLKREMRKLWITRINAASRMNDISYSQLMYGLKIANINVNRKMLSEIAIHDPKGFASIVDKAKKAIKDGVETPNEEVAEEKVEVKAEEKTVSKKVTKEVDPNEKKGSAKKATVKTETKKTTTKKPTTKKVVEEK